MTERIPDGTGGSPESDDSPQGVQSAEMMNNAAENALRRVAVGRKNWLFCGSDNGGATAAVLFSLIATCQRHKVNPFDYLRDVLTRIAATPISQLDLLLPNRWKPAPSKDAK